MVLIVCARAPSREATWCLSTPVVARLTPTGSPDGFAPPPRGGFAFEHRGTGRFITNPASNDRRPTFSAFRPISRQTDFSHGSAEKSIRPFVKIGDYQGLPYECPPMADRNRTPMCPAFS